MNKRLIVGVGLTLCLLGVITLLKFTEDTSKAEYLQKRDSIYLDYAKAKQSVRNTLLNNQNDGEKLYAYFDSDGFGQLVTTIEHTANNSIAINESYNAKTDDPNKYQDTAKELREYQEVILNLVDTKSEIPNRIALLLLFLTDESENIADVTERLQDPKNYRNVNDMSVEWT